MKLYIDESGDPGINVSKEGTSPHFVVAGVLLRDDSEVDRCTKGLMDFKNEHGLKRSEFKFNQMDNSLRALYLRAAALLPWQYFAIVLNKGKLKSPGFKYKETVYKYTVSLLIKQAEPLLIDATVIFDSLGSRDFKRTMTPYCKKRATKADGSEGIKRVAAAASHSDPLLQLADMVAGAVARSYKPEYQNRTSFRSLIKGREQLVQFWPN